ncbi:hydroxymethylpyrimidine/phosphomethylpyrimidine kinase [Antricoccus suffuscus]|uniref:Hydroxymethylpyrimidine/phosphomethylpyrimidine kinase n=1 Tax=Antricoccus suffuscus TaxID=1629062 RepID=A0A2T0ZZU7_9ACTN|nr:bifunctional hydroxymethylpyrimidine kinase/phosphomethylpyrimidine kinase [Antricoccus suffuscus]PRZ41879.1 hydroxymethylpyrimidine/phosphomethylpyrimidine kinase [Antricoccus suffuscus]
MNTDNPTSIPRVLSIAGTDPTGGAGIQADLKSIAANGGYGMAVVTALVAQNTTGVRSVHVPPSSFLTEQLDAVSDDVAIDAVKIGMLGNVEIIDTVRGWLDRARPPIVVLDPVMVATSGDRLLDAEAEAAMRALLSRVDLVTPNIPELAVLAEEDAALTWEAVLAQATRVSAAHSVIVLAKGGHLDGDAAPDALVDASAALSGRRTVVEFPGRRIKTKHTHGTGCSLSSALATVQPQTGNWEKSVAQVKAWLTESIANGAGLHVGHGHGPVHHFAGMWSRGGTVTRSTADDVAKKWWTGIRSVRDGIDALPFVRGLGDGTLGHDQFSWYLAQDALYLRDYSRVLAHASALAATTDEQTFWAANAHGALATELQLHEGWLGPEHTFDTPPSATTTAYLNHLLACAARGDYAVLIAALLPCFWIYDDVGARLHPLATPGHPYRSWLQTYADPQFAALSKQAVEIVTGLAARADIATQQAMWEAFRTSADHELAFFAAPHAAVE